MKLMSSWCRRRLCRVAAPREGGHDGGAYAKLPAGGRRAVGRPPKGQLVVYVGQEEEKERVFLPVEYVNHPLFAELLGEASEDECGLRGEGGIIVPCSASEFEDVRAQIAAMLEARRRGEYGAYWRAR